MGGGGEGEEGGRRGGGDHLLGLSAHLGTMLDAFIQPASCFSQRFPSFRAASKSHQLLLLLLLLLLLSFSVVLLPNCMARSESLSQ